MACLQTPGAFLLGLRLMALDGHLVEVPDTPENAAYFGRFGRPRSDRGEAAYPKVQSVLLCELGTHAIVDAGFWPYGVSEQKGAFRLLRSLGPGMLVFVDRGLYSFDLVEAITKRGAQAVCRLSSRIKPQFVRPLGDGSYLAYIHPETARKARGAQSICGYNRPRAPNSGRRSHAGSRLRSRSSRA